MITAQEYVERFRAILKSHGSPDGVELSLSYRDIASARQTLITIRQIQKELRQVKKEISQTVKEINADYSDARANTRATGLSGFVGGRSAIHQVAQKKQQLSQAKIAATAPYNSLSQSIDRTLVGLDSHKVQIDIFIAKEKADRSLG